MCLSLVKSLLKSEMDIAKMIMNRMIEVSCPSCKFVTDMKIKESLLQEPVICRGCKRTLIFDEDGSVSKSKKGISRASNDLNKVLSKTINLTIKL